MIGSFGYFKQFLYLVIGDVAFFAIAQSFSFYVGRK